MTAEHAASLHRQLPRKGPMPRSANTLRPIRKPFRLLRFDLDPARGCDAAAAFVDHVEHLAVGIGSARGLDSGEAYFLGVALREAIMKALRHGRGADGGGRVTVSFRLSSENLLDITVRDRGCGFDPAGLPEPPAGGSGEGALGRRRFSLRAF